MSADNSSNGWSEYSRMVLKELETLADSVDVLRNELQTAKRDITKIETRESKVDEIKEWKAKMDEVVSPVQLKDIIKEHKENREFMIRAVTVIAIIQFIITSAVVWTKLFN